MEMKNRKKAAETADQMENAAAALIGEQTVA